MIEAAPRGRVSDRTSGTWWPAIDGLRGVAVAAVLVYHHDPHLLPGGFLGVSLFFTVSGFLITTLLLREHDSEARIGIVRFWVRRCRRLAPVALAGLVLASAVAAGNVDAVVVLIGSIQLADWQRPDDPQPRSFGDPVFEERYRRAAHSALEVLEGIGVPVLLTTVPVPAWDPSALFPGKPVPGTGPLTINDPGRALRMNQLTRSVASAHPLTRVVPYAELISRADGSVDSSIRPDGLHLDPAAVPGLMDGALGESFRIAYREVVAGHPGARRASGATIWSP